MIKIRISQPNRQTKAIIRARPAQHRAAQATQLGMRLTHIPPVGNVGSSGKDIGAQAASATQRAKDTAQTAYDQTKQVVNDAYSKTSEVLSSTYDQTMTYGPENPGKLTFIAFGAGIGIGLLLAETRRRAKPHESHSRADSRRALAGRNGVLQIKSSLYM